MVSTIRLGRVLGFAAFGLISVVGAGAEPSESAEALVEQALVAELGGDLARRRKLLEAAVTVSAEYAPACWHAGMVRIDDVWLAVEAAEQRAAMQGLVAEYRRLRDRYAETAAGQAALARWCRQKQWTDLEKWHWTNVLRISPGHREARSRLGVREYRGMLLTKQQIDQYKEGRKAYDRAVEDWKPRLKTLAKAIASDDPAERDRGSTELRAIGESAALPAMQQELLEADEDWGEQLVRAIGNIKGQAAVDTLVYCSVLSPKTVREAAAEQLKQRSLFSYVPTLLGAFESPIELSYYVKTFADGVHYGYEATQETPDVTYVQSRNHHETRSMMIYRIKFDILQRVDMSRPLTATLRRGTREVITARDTVAKRNQRVETKNERIAAALVMATGQQLGQTPQSWWQWWADYNQLNLNKQTVRDDRVTSVSQNIRRVSQSCFLRGTQVWTDTGPLPIEDVRAGDRVLSQNQETGELAYKHVVDTTIRPPSPSIRLRVGGEEIVATLGHPMWVAGKGWRMTKELRVGELLHGVHGSVPIDDIEPGPEAEAYNLVVADFHNYFVGKERVLVHDNHMRRVTEAALPGFVLVKE